MTSDGSVELLCDDMDLCGDVVQSLAEYLALEDLASTCDFPEETQVILKSEKNGWKKRQLISLVRTHGSCAARRSSG